jgi:CheY-like chemotaxis protein
MESTFTSNPELSRALRLERRAKFTFKDFTAWVLMPRPPAYTIYCIVTLLPDNVGFSTNLFLRGTWENTSGALGASSPPHDTFCPHRGWQSCYPKCIAQFFETLTEWKIIDEAGDGAEAIKKASELMPDMILLDFSMPKKNGIEAASVLKKMFPHAHIIDLYYARYRIGFEIEFSRWSWLSCSQIWRGKYFG